MKRGNGKEILRTALIALILLCASLILLRLLNERAGMRTESAPPEPSPSAQETPPGGDGSLLLRVWSKGELRTVSAADYLPGVVAGEMPADFSDEALRAQAVAARTYILWKTAHGCAAHPEADVCDEPGCCKAWRSETDLRERWGENYEENWARMCAACADTDGWYLSWEGAPIQAVFHSSSPGRTENSAALWEPLPYLVSVESPETAADVPDFVTEVELSADALRRTLCAARPEADFSGPAENWVGEIVRDEAGRVESAVLGGERFTGQELRQLLGLRSACFAIEGEENGFLLRVTGFGHGVGMSQYGAEVMARGGASWREIVLHYYPGAELAAL